MRRLITVVLAAGLIVGLAGCSDTSKYGQQFKDAGVSARNTAEATIGTMPDGFSNWAAKCDGPNMVYVVFKSDGEYGSIDVVANDPRCTP